ncbi:alpha/beta fold hydrolase [Bacillus sp. DX1.1]|uniref:alpha/beta fold hydrolase n=1 Tax=unclassified Bacillus (in: firmicutes) TaxID=185979 RepID=UPI002571251B|nr:MULTISPECIES: alpha/beta fold hydrolase [unclassified Bacillus (in: firmicutes)]MDM5154574.1 alpha/beta fold hydrolase [Bacillus sp. DX1.1]WJE83467.1 alpha/beta fold hydrolase [Bacillus sp. DX3.1]
MKLLKFSFVVLTSIFILFSSNWFHVSAKAEIDVERQKPITFVLIHGAWGDSSYWDKTANELKQMGHKVHTPNLPGHGKDKNKSVKHTDYVKSVVNYVKERNLKDFVLVGHSFGGTVISKVAEQIPDRIKRLVFMDAFVLADGNSVADEIPAEGKQLWTELTKKSKDHAIQLPFPIWRETFMNNADLSLAKKIYETVTPEPAGPLFEKLNLSKFYKSNIPKSYFYLTEDIAVPQGEQYSWHPHMSSRLGLFRLVTTQGDHMTMFHVKPAIVAKKLVEAGRD